MASPGARTVVAAAAAVVSSTLAFATLAAAQPTPAAADSKPAAADSMPAAADSKPAAADSKPLTREDLHAAKAVKTTAGKPKVALATPAVATSPDPNDRMSTSAGITNHAGTSTTPSGNLELMALSDRWQDVPQRQRLKLSIQIIDEVTELGNLIGTSMNELSDDMVGLTFDGRRRRAKLRVGTGEGQYLRFRLDSDWHFAQGKARIVAKLQLGIGEHHWNIELPDMEMAPANVHGQRGVEVRIPFFEKKF